MTILEALALAKSGKKARPVCWDAYYGYRRCWIECRMGILVECGEMQEIPQRMRFEFEEELLGEWEVIE